MSATDRYLVTTTRTYRCDGCGVTTEVVESHEPPHDKAFLYSGEDQEALEPPFGWVTDPRERKHYHSRDCGEAALAARLVAR